MGRIFGPPAGADHLRGQRVGVGVAHLVIERRLANLDHLVAGRNDGRHRLTVDPHAHVPHGGEQRDVSVVQALARVQQRFSGRRFATSRIDVLSRFRRLGNAHPAAHRDGVLHHHHGVRARGQGRAGHDGDCLSGAGFAREAFARADLADDIQLAREIRRAHRKTIADGAGKRRGIAVGRHGFRQHASHGGEQRGLLDGGLGRRAQGLDDGFSRLGECQRGHRISVSQVAHLLVRAASRLALMRGGACTETRRPESRDAAR